MCIRDSRSAERDADRRAFPGHPAGQRLDLVERHGGVEADAALGRPARDAVLDAVAFEDLVAAIIHTRGNRDDELALRTDQDFAKPRLELQVLRRGVELA